MYVLSCVQLFATGPMEYIPPGSSVHGDSPGKNTGVGCHALLQGNFPTQGSNLGLPHCRQILFHLSHQGSPRILEWVAYPFSRKFPDPGVKLGSPELQMNSLPAELPGKPNQKNKDICKCKKLSDREFSHEENWTNRPNTENQWVWNKWHLPAPQHLVAVAHYSETLSLSRFSCEWTQIIFLLRSQSKEIYTHKHNNISYRVDT